MSYFKITTDETLREKATHGNSSYPFSYYLEDIWQFDFHQIDWHWHHELEFLSVTKGTVSCLVGTEKNKTAPGRWHIHKQRHPAPL